MKGEAGFEERVNWKDIERKNPPQKGFGNIGKKGKKQGESSASRENNIDKSPEGEYPMKKRSKLSPEKEKLVKELEKSGKLYIEPNIINKIDNVYIKKAVSNKHFKQILYNQFEDFPESLISFLAKQKEGQIVITTDVIAGFYDRGKNIAQINPEEILNEFGVFQEEITHLLDHLLGGQPENSLITLSGGHGINQAVRELGEEINGLYRRGEDFYFFNYMGENEREYLAQAVRQYLQDDPQIIEELDPLLYNMLNDKFLNDDFWRDVL